tara:strand:- start:4044 stop:5000 length:957 start_codon:yes stop_codon:yes gene_type:complete
MIMNIGAVIPCYKGGEKTLEIALRSLNYCSEVVIVDDNCPFKTGDLIRKSKKYNQKITILTNHKNRGVGFSTVRGFKYFLNKKFDVIVKLDADGQMNPDLIPQLIQPIIDKKADAVKGNRFTTLDHMIAMPKIRLFGNLMLTFLNKLSTGYWELSDPTNGFLAFRGFDLGKIRLEKLDNRYFFESDLLFQCSLLGLFFEQLPMKSVYSNEISSLKPLKQILIFSKKHILNFSKRVIYQYFVLDFNAGSLEIITFFITSLSALITFTKFYLRGLNSQEFSSPGEANLISILIIISVQILLGILYFDSTHQPLMRQLKRR